MKQLFLILVFSITCLVCKAQVTLSQEQLDSLPQNVRQAIELSVKKQNLEDQIKNASEYASWGREIGYAVDGALSAVEEHVVNLSETGLGHTVIFLVCWKFLARDILGMVVGLCLFITMLWVIYSIVKTRSDWKDMSNDAQCATVICHWIGAAILFIASLACAF